MFRLVGSSPRVRGTLVMVMASFMQTRFIPAGAGNAAAEIVQVATVTVHPRGCGERIRVGAFSNVVDGSSPRVRGTLPGKHLHPLKWRFIPAGAGNAPFNTSTVNASPVHPRGCGERFQNIVPACRRDGSSPRVRGTRHRLRQ